MTTIRITITEKSGGVVVGVTSNATKATPAELRSMVALLQWIEKILVVDNKGHKIGAGKESQ